MFIIFPFPAHFIDSELGHKGELSQHRPSEEAPLGVVEHQYVADLSLRAKFVYVLEHVHDLGFVVTLVGFS